MSWKVASPAHRLQRQPTAPGSQPSDAGRNAGVPTAPTSAGAHSTRCWSHDPPVAGLGRAGAVTPERGQPGAEVQQRVLSPHSSLQKSENENGVSRGAPLRRSLRAVPQTRQVTGKSPSLSTPIVTFPATPAAAVNAFGPCSSPSSSFPAAPALPPRGRQAVFVGRGGCTLRHPCHQDEAVRRRSKDTACSHMASRGLGLRHAPAV